MEGNCFMSKKERKISGYTIIGAVLIGTGALTLASGCGASLHVSHVSPYGDYPDTYTINEMAVADASDNVDIETLDRAKSANTAAADSYVDGVPVDDAYTEGVASNAASNVVPEDEVQADTGMIHYTGDLSIDTTNFALAKTDISSAASHNQAYLVTENEYDNGSSTYVNRGASYEFRVPTEYFSSFMSELQTITGKVISTNVSSVDNTRVYNNNANRLDALETERDAILDMMQQASDTDVILSLHTRLAELDTDIANLKTSQNDISYDTVYSTVYLSLTDVYRYTETVSEPATFYERLNQSLNIGWTNTVNGAQDALVSAAEHPVQITLGLMQLIMGIGFLYNGLATKKKKNEPYDINKDEDAVLIPEPEEKVTDESEVSNSEKEITDSVQEDSTVFPVDTNVPANETIPGEEDAVSTDEDKKD